MSQKQKIFLAIVVIFSVTALVFLLFTTRHRPPKSIIGEDSVTVVIDNTDGLEKILLATQFGAVRQELADFIRAKIDKKIEYATIINQPNIKDNGDVVFQVKTGKPEKTFEVLLERKTFDTIDFTVASKNYHKTLRPYLGNTSTDNTLNAE